MGVQIMQELYFAHFQGGYSVYSVVLIISLKLMYFTGLTDQLIELILFVDGQPSSQLQLLATW